MHLAIPNKEEVLKSKTMHIANTESFFDDDDMELDPFDNRRKLWIKPQKSHLSYLKTAEVLYEGSMSKNGKKTGIKKIRYYILTPEMLVYKEVRMIYIDITNFGIHRNKVQGLRRLLFWRGQGW